MSTEIKSWLDLHDPLVRAKLAKEFIALGNHGGGYLLFGFREDVAGWPPQGANPYSSDRYSQDNINNILRRHAEPAFECYTTAITSSAGNPHVVVEVPGGHRVPIHAQRAPQGSGLIDNAYYIRRPGPDSAPASTAAEWQVLIRRCLDNDHERQVDAFRRVLGVIRAHPELAAEISTSSDNREKLSAWRDASLKRIFALEEGDA